MSQRSENQTGVPLAQQTLTEVYQLLLQQVTDGIFITNIEGHLLEANPYGCQLLGYTREEVRQLSWPDLWATEASADDPLYQNNLAIGHTANGRRSLRRKDNQLISVDITAHKLTTGNTVWSVHAIKDGQSQEVTLQERLEADEQLAKIVAIAPGVLCLFQLSPDGTATCPYADPAIQDIYGLTPEELAKDASPVLSLIHPHDVAGIQESIAESARTLLPWQAEYRVQHPDKGEIWVEGHSSPERRPDGTVLWHGFLQDITERKKAEIALRTNEAQLTLLTDALPALIAYVDANQCYQFNNQAYVNWFGYTKGELKGRHLEQVLGTAVYQAISSYTEQALAGETVKYETILPYEDEPRYVQAIYVPDRNAQGEVRGYFALVNDITSRKRAEEALYESQERLSLALSASQMGVWEWNIQTDALLWSPECLAILGVESYNKALVAFTDIVHPEDIEDVMAKANLAIVHKTIYEADFRIIRPDGDIRWVANVGQVKYDKDDKPLRLIGTIRDITERVRSQEALRKSEARFRSYFEIGLVGMAITSSTKGIVEVNDQLCSILGYSRNELLQLSWDNITHPDDLALDLALFAQIMSGESDEYSLEKRWIRKDGQVIHSAISVKCVRGVDGSINYLMKLVQDITKRKEAEAQLLYQANLLQNVSDAIIATDEHFKITTWNRTAEMMYGWLAEEVMGQGVDDILVTEYVADERDRVLQQFLQEGSWQGEVTQKQKNGATLNILSSVTMIKDSSGNLVSVVAVNRNITERKEAEKAQASLAVQLQQAQKMESMGELAGGVAHDFNNMLTVIQMYSELIRAKLPQDHPLIEKIDVIRHASQRSADLTRQLLAFSRKQIMVPKELDLNNLLTDLLRMVRRLIGEDIILTSILDPDLWTITADPGQIEQVIMNLVVNARDAMPTGGMLTIETHNVQLDETYATEHFETSPGVFVSLAITDTGQGMDRQTQSRIFEPFFTTKEPGKGTGLGLATVHGIVKQSGGSILVYSELGKGTSFKVYLPANVEISESLDEGQTQAISSGGSETILLVEDEDMVRELVQGALKVLGYKVLVAHRGDAALSLVEAFPNQIDLLLTDVVMPGMSGRELAEQLRPLLPQIKVLFMSGYTDDSVIRHGLLMADVEFLHKPFTATELATKVRQVLDKKVNRK